MLKCTDVVWKSGDLRPGVTALHTLNIRGRKHWWHKRKKIWSKHNSLNAHNHIVNEIYLISRKAVWIKYFCLCGFFCFQCVCVCVCLPVCMYVCIYMCVCMSVSVCAMWGPACRSQGKTSGVGSCFAPCSYRVSSSAAMLWIPGWHTLELPGDSPISASHIAIRVQGAASLVLLWIPGSKVLRLSGFCSRAYPMEPSSWSRKSGLTD